MDSRLRENDGAVNLSTRLLVYFAWIFCTIDSRLHGNDEAVKLFIVYAYSSTCLLKTLFEYRPITLSRQGSGISYKSD